MKTKSQKLEDILAAGSCKLINLRKDVWTGTEEALIVAETTKNAREILPIKEIAVYRILNVRARKYYMYNPIVRACRSARTTK